MSAPSYLSLLQQGPVTTSTITAPNLSVPSTTITLGQSAGSTKTNFSSGSYLPANWQTAQTGVNALKKTYMSATGQYQLAVSTSNVYLSSDSGVTWTVLTAANNPYGLPSAGNAVWLSGAVSATGQYIMLADSSGGYVYVSRDYGASFNSATPTGVSPYVWLKFNGDTTNSGTAAITPAVQGTITYSSTTPVIPGSQYAIFSNTAGGSAASGNYLRGAWTGSPTGNFTVSFWMNPQTLNGTQQHVCSAYGGAFLIYISTGNALVLQIPSGGGLLTALAATSSALSINTWYYITAIFQTGGSCSLYINNTLINSLVNSNGVGTNITSNFALGTYDTTTTNAFNGYLDDFKLYNTAIMYQATPVIPPAVWLKFEGSTADSGSNAITPTLAPTWTPTYVTGAVGSYAVRLANTAGGTASNYVQGAWSGATNFTMSFWFNAQTVVGGTQVIFSAYNGGVFVYLNTSLGVINYVFPSGSGTNTIYLGASGSITINTWYHVMITFQTNGTCSIYLNGVGTSSTNSGGFGSYTSSGIVRLGGYDHNATGAFNGYIDDFRLYNTAMPYNSTTPAILPLAIPANYNNCAISGSGQYLLASMATGQLLQSADYGVSWSVNTAGAGPQQSVTDLALSHSGQYAVVSRKKVVTPNTTAATSSQWIHPVNGLTWNVSASSNNAGVYVICNDTTPSSWATTTGKYDSTTGAYTAGTTSTTVQTITPAVAGEWVQIQCSTPVVLTGYNYTVGLTGQLWKTYYVCGSMNGTTWYPLHSAVMTGNATGTTYSRLNTVISVNYTGTQSLRGDQNGSVTTTAYSFATGMYTYFRWIATSTWATGGPTDFALDELYPQFQIATVSPQLTGLSAATWTQNGVTYTTSASSTYGGTGLPAYLAFNNNSGLSNGWATLVGTYNTTTGVVVPAGSTTTISTIGSVIGEWIQLQTSVPLSLQSYTFANVDTPPRIPKIYYIVGSMDGSTWVPIHYAAIGSTNPFTANNTVGSYITINYTGTQTMTAGAAATMTTTSYSTSTGSYLYFRMIINSIFPTNDSITQLGELYLNFSTPTLTSSNTLVTWSGNGPQVATAPNPADATALSGSGQVLVQNTKILPYAWLPFDPAVLIVPQMTGLGVNTWNTSGISWTASASSSLGAPALAPYGAFNNYYGNSGVYSWGSASSKYNASSPYNYISGGGATTTIQGGIGAKEGEYLQLQSSAPLVLTSYSFACGGYLNLPKEYYIVGSNDGTTWYPLQYCLMTTNPLTANFHTCTSYLQMNYTGTQTIQGDVTGSGTTTAYASYTTQAYTYFRILALSVYGNGTVFELGEWFMNFANPAADVMGNTVATVTGSVTYTTDRLGNSTGAVVIANTAGGSASNYIRYPYSSTTTPTITVSCWANFQTLPTTNQYSGITAFGNATDNLLTIYYLGGSGLFFAYTRGSGTNTQIANVASISTGTWYHFCEVFSATGTCSAYVNGQLIGSIVGGPLVGAATTLALGTNTGNNVSAFNGYIDDVRIYNTALNATHVAALYNGQNALQCLTTSASYLPATSYSMPSTLASSSILATATSFNGQIIVYVTAATTSNVYYSLDRGVTWNTVTVPTSATDSLQGCAVSSDGSYITVNSNTSTYTLNTNTAALGLAIGSQAGQYNQGANAIAIGNQAGVRNQSANSIVLNASGAAVNTGAPGFYVAPVAQAATSAASGTLQILGYGADSQVVQTGVTVGTIQSNIGLGSTGNTGVGIGTTPYTSFQIYTPAYTNQPIMILDSGNPSGATAGPRGIGQPLFGIGSKSWYAAGDYYGIGFGYTAGNGNQWNTVGYAPYPAEIGFLTQSTTGQTYGDLVFSTRSGTGATIASERMRITSGGNVGIGTTAPYASMHIYNTNNSRGNSFWIYGKQSGILLDSRAISGGGAYNIWVAQGGVGDTNVGGLNIYDEVASAFRIVLSSSGYFGIGTVNPDALLSVNGAATKPGGGSWGTFSDERMKHDIIMADTAMCYNTVKSLALKRYTFNDDMFTTKQIYDRSKLGWIAQEVETIFPKAVTTTRYTYNQQYEEVEVKQEDGTTKIEKKLVSEDAIDDCRVLDVDQIYAVMYGATQQLIATTEALQTTADLQQSINTEFNASIRSLQAAQAVLEADNLVLRSQLSTLIGLQQPVQPSV